MIVVQAKPVDYDSAVDRAKGKVPDKPVVNLGTRDLHKIFDNYRIIGDVEVDERHMLRIAAGTLDGYRYVTIREFYYNHYSGTFKPARFGVRIPMISPFYEDGKGITLKNVGDDVLANIVKAFAEAQTMDLADPNNALYIDKHYIKKDAVKMKETSNNENRKP